MANPEQASGQEFRFLDITDWDTHQSDGAGVHWIKDYVDKEGGFAYSKLSAYQRYLFDALSRLRGRLSQRIPNDPLYISTALMLTKRDRPHVAQGVRALEACGMLTFSNEQAVCAVKSPSKKDAHGTHMAPTQDVHGTQTVPTQDVHGTHTVHTRYAHSSEPLRNEQHDLQSRVEQNRVDVEETRADCTAIAIPDSKTLDSKTSLDSTAIKDQNPVAEFLLGNGSSSWRKILTSTRSICRGMEV